MITSWQENYDKPRQCVERQKHCFADKGLYGFPSGHVPMRELDRKEGRMSKNWCLWVVLEKAPEIPLDSKAIKSVSLKGKQPWIVIERADTEAETPVFWLSDANSWLIGKGPDAGKNWGQKKRASEDEMAGWHHRCNGHELGQTSGDGERQRSLMCCCPWDCEALDMTWRLNTKKD